MVGFSPLCPALVFPVRWTNQSGLCKTSFQETPPPPSDTRVSAFFSQHEIPGEISISWRPFFISFIAKMRGANVSRLSSLLPGLKPEPQLQAALPCPQSPPCFGNWCPHPLKDDAQLPKMPAGHGHSASPPLPRHRVFQGISSAVV